MTEKAALAGVITARGAGWFRGLRMRAESAREAITYMG
ncbi:hypothetical protein OCAR_7398 [Afipia carboxidovorans OM5]|nr:hypothetical protein OCAR_7398 [Afipia carboxidovorans OM5]